jgi:hypothetical protein
MRKRRGISQFIEPDDYINVARKGQGEVEDKLNDSMYAIFSTAPGQRVLAYLQNITLDMVAGPNVTVEHMIHREGQRYIVADIVTRIKKGSKQ